VIIADYSRVSWPLAAGTVVYAQADAYNADTTYGAILESHEISGGAYDNNIGNDTVPQYLFNTWEQPGS
jgi:hypothetical protein